MFLLRPACLLAIPFLFATCLLQPCSPGSLQLLCLLTAILVPLSSPSMNVLKRRLCPLCVGRTSLLSHSLHSEHLPALSSLIPQAHCLQYLFGFAFPLNGPCLLSSRILSCFARLTLLLSALVCLNLAASGLPITGRQAPVCSAQHLLQVQL